LFDFALIIDKAQNKQHRATLGKSGHLTLKKGGGEGEKPIENAAWYQERYENVLNIYINSQVNFIFFSHFWM
jgi:hypothetical protein